MNDKEKIEKALGLLNEMIRLAEKKDEEHKEEALARGNSEQAVGESYDLFYLRMLKDILENGIV